LFLFAGAAWMIAFVFRNLHSLREGCHYLWHLCTWNPVSGQRIQPDGAFGMCYQLAACTNAQRCQLIRADLQALGLLVEQVPVPGEMLPNLFVRLGPDGPLLLLVAHYDKSRETPAYQAASDNTAAVVVLLAALHSLVAGGTAINQPIGVLFTSAEERGLLGAKAFVEHAQQQQIAIAAALNFDMLGRERLAIRPSALPGFYFELPLIGWFVYDGRHIRRGNAYPQPDTHLVAQIKRVANDLVVYQRFTAASDSNVFQDASIPTVSISSADMFYLDTIWERDSDRIELLDQRNLERARQMICQLVRYDD
jgi:Zn-dependent M28 family amino/carboxypeptidase